MKSCTFIELGRYTGGTVAKRVERFTAIGYECFRNALLHALDIRISRAYIVIYYELKYCVTERQLMARYATVLEWVLLFLVRYIIIRNIEIYFRYSF